MRRTVLIFLQWLSSPDSDSVLRANMPGLAWLTERGRITRTLSDPPLEVDEGQGQSTETPEAAWLGLDPASLALQDGPLTVSALGADPPAGSVHFHLSLLSLFESKAAKPKNRLKDDELRIVLEASKKLNTKRLTIVPGEQLVHGLVWEEGSIEMGSFTSEAVAGKEIEALLPEGDGETILRRFIDDSVNLLSELPLNREREDEGLEPLNLWWPWGQGFRVPSPNLALRRGDVAIVESNSTRFQGLARLCGYRHGDRPSFGWGVRTNLEQILTSVRTHSETIAVIDAFATFREHERWEEMEWLTRELDDRLFKPIAGIAREQPLHLTVAATSSEDGMALEFQSGSPAANTTPFDERAFEDPKLETARLWQIVDRSL